MGLRALALTAFVLAAPLPALADEVDDCEKLGVESMNRDSGFGQPFEIVRDKLYFDKAETTVGSQFVSSVLHGVANLDTGGKMESVRFVCLHGGTNVGALFVWFLPD